MINEVFEYMKENQFESCVYASMAAFWSYATYVSYRILRNRNLEDKLKEEENFF